MALIPSFCGRDYGRDVMPLSTAVREANRRNHVMQRAFPWSFISTIDNDWVAFLAQQPGIGSDLPVGFPIIGIFHRLLHPIEPFSI